MSKPWNEWLTSMYNLVENCGYPRNSKDRIIRDVLIIGYSSDKAKDQIVQQGEAVTLNQVIEILQTEESTIETPKASKTNHQYSRLCFL